MNFFYVEGPFQVHVQGGDGSMGGKGSDGKPGNDKNTNFYCRIQGNTKLYKLKNYKPIYKYKYFSGNDGRDGSEPAGYAYWKPHFESPHYRWRCSYTNLLSRMGCPNYSSVSSNPGTRGDL